MNDKSQITVPLVPSICKCFEIVMTEAEMDFLISVGNRCLTRDALAELYQKNDFDVFFAEILRKSLMWCKNDGYELAPIFPGWIEVYGGGDPSDPTRQEMLREFAKFEKLLSQLNIPPVRAYMNRLNSRKIRELPARMSVRVARGSKTVDLNEPITSEQAVTTAGEILPILERHAGEIGVMHCFCRMLRGSEGETCAFHMPLEACMMVGKLSHQIAESGVGRMLTLDEAKQLIAECEQKGCIHTIYHYGMDTEQEELAICNCCVDCCFLYHGYQSGSLSQIMTKSYVIPQIIEETACVGCGKCGKFCPTQATGYDKQQKKLWFEPQSCIGCGQCVTQCPFPVRKLVPQEWQVFVKTRSKRSVPHA